MSCDCCFILGVDDGLYLSAAIFPDDDMARSDSRMKEESRRIQAKYLMEIHVMVLFYSWMSVDWISRI